MVTAHTENAASMRTATPSAGQTMSARREKCAFPTDVKLDAAPMNSAWTISPASATSAEIRVKAVPPVAPMQSVKWSTIVSYAAVRPSLSAALTPMLLACANRFVVRTTRNALQGTSAI